MANFVTLIDPRPDARTRFAAAVAAQLAPVDGLAAGELSSGDMSAAWTAHPQAPVSTGSGAVVWGDALADSGERLRAAEFSRQWPAARNGFHAAVAHDAGSGTTVAGADPLGLFPIFYWSSGEALLIGSSPDLFAHYEGFREEICAEGLVGVLLANNLVGGRSLLRGVRRLGAGNRLVWRPRGEPAEETEYRPPVAAAQADRTLEEELEGMDAALADAVRRHAPPAEPHGLLLSGGRDSRMLAGYLRRAGTGTTALTLGVRGEDDQRLARRVARVLGMASSTAEVSDERFPEFAQIEARWEQLANGFSGPAGWGYTELARALPPRVVTGYLCDSIVGGSHISWADADPGAPPSFEAFFSKLNAWAVDPDALRRLLRSEVFEGGLMDQVIERIRDEYEARQAWAFDLANRQRFHVGGQAWRLSFGGWPVLPATDRQVVDAAASAGVALLAGRALQDALLVERFPKLAAIPLAGEPWPGVLRRSPQELARHGLTRAWQKLAPGRDPAAQRYTRMYDFNGPGWRAVRRGAEQHRELAHEFFDERVLAELLPGPEASPRFEDPIVGPAGAKLLLGFMIWAGGRAA